MSKIVYPENENLMSIVQNPINDTIQYLNTAVSQCNYVIPNDFAYLSYLKSLPTTIAGYRSKLYEVFGDIDKIDMGYQTAMDTMDTYKDALQFTTLEERDRLVK